MAVKNAGAARGSGKGHERAGHNAAKLRGLSRVRQLLGGAGNDTACRGSRKPQESVTPIFSGVWRMMRWGQLRRQVG